MFGLPLIAIDIGSSAIKVLELSGGRNRKISSIGFETLEPGVVEDGEIANLERVSEILQELLKKLKIFLPGRRAAISMSGSSLLIKRTSIPAVPGAEMDAVIESEAEQVCHGELNDLYWRAKVLSDQPSQEGTLPLLVVAAKRDILEQHIELVRMAGLRTGVVDCDVLSTSNMFEYNYGVSDSVICVVNVGASSSQLSLMHNGAYLYTREIPLGGKDYTATIMESMGVDFENAEAMKLSASQGDSSVPAEVHTVINDFNEQLSSQAHSAIEDFRHTEGSSMEIPMTHAFFVGGGARVLGLDAAFAAALQVPVQLINPFHRIQAKSRKVDLEFLLNQGHLFGVAVGLGLRSMNDDD